MQFFSLNIYNGTYREFLELIKHPFKKTLIFTPNPEILLRASQDEEFLHILQQADYLTPDANGLYVGSLIQEGKSFLDACIRILFQKSRIRDQYGELIQWSNLTRDLVEYAQQEGKKIMIIDNYRITEPQNPFEVRKMEIQAHFQELFHQRFPELDVCIVFDGQNSPAELAQMIKQGEIFAVFSCIGMKTQEKRLREIWEYLDDATPVLGLWVGSSFDYLLGLQKRAPLWMQNLGLEWFYRLILSPRTRYQRIIDALWRFPMMVKKYPQ
jgi:exopolysaccharide biosynthesis WecB/TagA/CpsF family protein